MQDYFAFLGSVGVSYKLASGRFVSLVDSVRKGELEGLNSDGILELEACGGEILVVGVGEID